MASSAEIEEFLAGPLVAWLKTCIDDIDNKLDCYENYFDGFPFRDVLLKIDPDPVDPVPRLANFPGDVTLISARTQIFYTIFNNIQTIYTAELNQLVLKVPDILKMAEDPSTKGAFDNIKFMLQLLLSCAVQGPTREYFVNKIRAMPEPIQEELAKIISEVTMPNSELVANTDEPNVTVKICQDQMRELITERNNYLQIIIEEAARRMAESQSCVVYENEKERQQQQNQQTAREADHMAVEIMDYKAQIRRLKQSVDEKSDNIAELTEALTELKNDNKKLKAENKKLHSDSIKNLRAQDEWESLRYKADQAETLEKEATNLRKSLIDAKCHRNRMDQLFNDNKSLERSVESLEVQVRKITEENKRLQKNEKKLLESQKTINDLELDLENANSKLEQQDKRISELQKIADLATRRKVAEEEEEPDEAYPDSYNYSIGEELKNNAEARILQLQLEKRQLQLQITQLEEKTFHENGSRILELEKDKKKLSIQCENLQAEVDRLTESNAAIENLFKKTIDENIILHGKVDSLQIAKDKLDIDLALEKERQIDLQKQIDFCNKEKENVLLLCNAIKSRADKTDKSSSGLVETVEKLRKEVDEGREIAYDNEKLKEVIESLEKDISNLHKELSKSKELVEAKNVIVDKKMDEIEALKKHVETLSREKSDMLEQLEKLQDCEMKAQELLSQAAVQCETILTLQEDLVAEKVNNDKFKRNVERLGLNLDFLENDINFVLEKMLDNLEVSKTLTAIYKTRDGGALVADKLEEMAGSLTEEWRQEVEKLQAEIANLIGSNEGLKKDNASLEVGVATLKSQLQSLQVQQTALRLANSQLVAEKEDLSRRNQLQLEQNNTLSHDQSVLGNIHAELTLEYEKLLEEREYLKKNNRDLKAEIRSGNDKLENMETKLETVEKQLEKAKEDSKHLSFLRTEHTKLKHDFRGLFSTSEKFKAECKSSREELQTLRTEFSELKSQNFEMKNELTSKTEAAANFQMENAVLQQKCEMLQENLNKLDLTRISLLDSFSQLCQQTLVCMADSMDRQTVSQMEAKRYWEQYNNMLRQKDKLEEKIFDFYKKLDNVNTKKGGFASLVRRVRKAGSGIMSRSRSNRRSSGEDTTPATPTGPTQAEPQVAGPSCSASGESNNSSNGNDSDEDAIRPADPLPRTPSGSLHGHRPRDEVALRRSQRQLSRRNSVASEELLLRDSPSLGSIGSRRTVYISEDEPVPSPTPLQQTPVRDNNPPLLVYNRISTVIGGDTLCTLGNQTNLPEIPRPNLDNKKPLNPKETAVWYEYGCV